MPGASAHDEPIGTEASDALCRAIAELSGGTALLSFSRGKDSIATWLQLRRFFDRVIPFHCANVPGLSFVDESLRYYEDFFETPILRLMTGECLSAVHDLVYQPIEDERSIEMLDLWEYDKQALCDAIRAVHGVPRAWCAHGITASDSIERRVKVTESAGRYDDLRWVYPCFDWTRPQILDAIRAHGVKLPADYRLANRSFAGIPTARHLARMETIFPADFARVESMYPFIRAAMARNDFRRNQRAAV